MENHSRRICGSVINGNKLRGPEAIQDVSVNMVKFMVEDEDTRRKVPFKKWWNDFGEVPSITLNGLYTIVVKIRTEVSIFESSIASYKTAFANCL